MRTKEELKREAFGAYKKVQVQALEAYEKVRAPAWEAYLKRVKEIGNGVE